MITRVSKAADADHAEKRRKGFVLLYRCIADSAIFKNAELFRLFVYLLLKANHAEKELVIRTGRGETHVRVRVGQCITSTPKLATKMRTGQTNVRRWLAKLKANRQIEIETNSHYSLITICNWTTYQLPKGGSEQATFAENGEPSGEATGEATGYKQPLDQPLRKNSLRNQEAARGVVSGVSKKRRWETLTTEALRDPMTFGAWLERQVSAGLASRDQEILAWTAREKAINDSTLTSPAGWLIDTVRDRRSEHTNNEHERAGDEARKFFERGGEPRRSATSSQDPPHLSASFMELPYAS